MSVLAVWYAAYGSNTDAERFTQYLHGCHPPVDEAPESRPGAIELPLRFAGETTRWGAGGVAFVEPDPGSGAPVPTLVRLWRLPVDVLAQVGAQENRLPCDAARLDLDEVEATGRQLAFPGRWYDAWVGCGTADGIPVVTLTSSVIRTANPPGPRYAGVVARGLRTTHDLTAEDVAAYLAARSGLAPSVLLAWQQEDTGYGTPNA